MDPRSSAPDGTGRVQSNDDNFVEGYGGGGQRNPKAQPGNGDGQGRVQSEDDNFVEGYPRVVAPNPNATSSGDDGTTQGDVRRYTDPVTGRGLSTRRVNDSVGQGGFKKVSP